MPYTLKLSDGITTLVTVPDFTIVGPLALNAPSNCSLNFVGRGATGYSEAMGTNLISLLQNFSSSGSPLSPLTGQLWYNSQPGGNSTLQLFSANNTWVQVMTSDAPLTLIDQDITVKDLNFDSATLGCNGTITLTRLDSHPWIKMQGANGVNAVVLGLGVDGFGKTDLTITTNDVTGSIYHSGNIMPFVLNTNNVSTGYNLFTNTTTMAEVIVKTGGGITDITGGSINVKNYSGLGATANVVLWSPNFGSPNNVSLAFGDPDLTFKFTAGSTNTDLVLSPASLITPNTITVFHTGNLQPIVQNAFQQYISGNVNFAGTVSSQGDGVFGYFGGSSKLTLNSFDVLTTDNIANVVGNYLPLTGGTLTGSLHGTTGSFTTSLYVNGAPVLTAIPSLPYLPLSGGLVTGSVSINNNLSIGSLGGSSTLTLNGLPIATSGSLSGYLPITGGTMTGSAYGPAFAGQGLFVQNDGDCDLWFQTKTVNPSTGAPTNKAVISASETGGYNNLNFYNYMSNPSAPGSMTLGPTGILSSSNNIVAGKWLRAVNGATTLGSDNNCAVLKGEFAAMVAALGSSSNGIIASGLAAHGWIKFQNGLIINWGHVNIPAGDGLGDTAQSVTDTLLLGFNTGFIVLTSLDSAGVGTLAVGGDFVSAPTITQVVISGGGGSNDGSVYWLAIGM